jgi:hypothetical protein
LTLQLPDLDVLQFQLSLNLTHRLFLAAHLHIMTLIGALSGVVVGSLTATQELNKAQFFV